MLFCSCCGFHQQISHILVVDVDVHVHADWSYLMVALATAPYGKYSWLQLRRLLQFSQPPACPHPRLWHAAG